ncbi:hypothetical protein SK128_022940, partial [Halocaridina rubra]
MREALCRRIFRIYKIQSREPEQGAGMAILCHSLCLRGGGFSVLPTPLPRNLCHARAVTKHYYIHTCHFKGTDIISIRTR